MRINYRLGWRRRAASRALRRLTAELERLRRKFGHVDYARLVRAPTAEWVAGEDALLDTLICKREALLICETLDLHLVTAAVTGDMRLAWGTNGGRGGLLHRLNRLANGDSGYARLLAGRGYQRFLNYLLLVC